MAILRVLRIVSSIILHLKLNQGFKVLTTILVRISNYKIYICAKREIQWYKSFERRLSQGKNRILSMHILYTYSGRFYAIHTQWFLCCGNWHVYFMAKRIRKKYMILLNYIIIYNANTVVFILGCNTCAKMISNVMWDEGIQ